MAIVITETFTEASDTALASHTPDTRPGSEAWAVDSGSVTVSGANDRAEVAGTGDHIAYVNYSLDGDFEIEASFGGVAGNVSEDFVYPAINAYLVSDRSDLCGFYVSVFSGQYVLYYVSANDSETTDTYAFPSGVPSSGTLKLVRTGDMLYGYVDGVQRCSLDLSGTTDFAGSPSVYPGLGWGTFTGGTYPWWDDFSVDDGEVGGETILDMGTLEAEFTLSVDANWIHYIDIPLEAEFTLEADVAAVETVLDMGELTAEFALEAEAEWDTVITGLQAEFALEASAVLGLADLGSGEDDIEATLASLAVTPVVQGLGGDGEAADAELASLDIVPVVANIQAVGTGWRDPADDSVTETWGDG